MRSSVLLPAAIGLALVAAGCGGSHSAGVARLTTTGSTQFPIYTPPPAPAPTATTQPISSGSINPAANQGQQSQNSGAGANNAAGAALIAAGMALMANPPTQPAGAALIASRQSFESILARIVGGISGGDFHAEPDRQTCEFCDFDARCDIARRPQWERKAEDERRVSFW